MVTYRALMSDVLDDAASRAQCTLPSARAALFVSLRLNDHFNVATVYFS